MTVAPGIAVYGFVSSFRFGGWEESGVSDWFCVLENDDRAYVCLGFLRKRPKRRRRRRQLMRILLLLLTSPDIPSDPGLCISAPKHNTRDGKKKAKALAL